MSRYHLFVEHIVGLLENQELATPLRNIFEAAPTPFWFAPASASGKYHPKYALGEGGLVRHTLAVVHVARDLARPYGLTDKMDAITIAAAIHDLYKGGKSETWETTVEEHPELVAEAVFDELSRMFDDTNISNCVVMELIEAAQAAQGHMSLWGKTPRAISSGLTPMQSLVSTADYVISRKFLEPSSELAEILERF